MSKILLFVEEGYEDLELQYPRLRMMEAGFKVVIAGAKKGASYKGKNGYPCQADIGFADVKVDEYVGMIIPGGHAPDKLRMEPKVLESVRKMDKKRKMIAFICHAGWVPVSAGVIKGITCTSYKAIKDDMVNAGAKWVDQAVVRDKHFISSRNPNDLPSFCAEILKFLNK